MPIASPSFFAYVRIVPFTLSEIENGGYTLILSPLCTPVRSTSSMIPGTNTSIPSHTASTSTSLPTIYLSTSTGFSSLMSTALFRYLRSDPSSETICIALPPSTNEGRTSTGYPISEAVFTPSSIFVTAFPSGFGISSSSSSFSNASLSSALSIALQSVPIILTPQSARADARFIAVCPPSEAITPYGFSRSITFMTSSTVSGSK